MKISVIGLGWYGEPLAQELQKSGHRISGSTRTKEKEQSFYSQNINAERLSYPDLPSDNLMNADIVILNIPPFEEELQWFKNFEWNAKTWLIFISSTSVYPTPETKSGHLLQQQEEWVQNEFEHWTILRFGGLYGGSRHPGKSLSGKKNLAGRMKPVNLIHLDDCIGFTKTVIEKRLQNKIFNVVSDDHRTREEFYTEHCRKAGLPLPEFDQNDLSQGKIVPNEEMKKYYSFL